MNSFARFVAPILALAIASSALAAETETLYLSGKGKDDPVKWDFMCSAGMKANTWSTIGVPSNWELQGFGIYTYGTDRKNPWPKVQGHYKRTFTTPANWGPDKQTFIVFEGVMTDTQVKVNGQSAGPLHAGGYYRFKYDITKLLKPAGGGENTLEVTVDDESATDSVNRAERRGDYWNYAGIYRPVYLEAVPETHIEGVAIDAKADGAITVDIRAHGGAVPADQPPPDVIIRVLDLDGRPIGQLNRAGGPETGTHFAGKIDTPKLWTAETPNLYQLEASIVKGNTVIHTLHQKFGFRTLEVRPGAGLFLNGSRIMFKGVDRHCFWPDSGRCLSEKLSRDDIALLKDLNMNAVRCSHYPPDQHFLDACDELGIYILDELAGWHQAYDTTTGHRLVQEMVTRDVNHPCIMFWDNGNEGGWNTALDNDFAQWDPQKRLVIHPQQTQAQKGLDNSHYPQYSAVVTKSAGNNVFFPTEMIHGLYDGGHGAGLEDYWKVMMAGKASAGGFLWSFNDEDIVRTDKGGILDSNGNQAPDGITGPYREKEGSFYTIKQVWSPVALRVQGGAAAGQSATLWLNAENHFDFTDLNQCSIRWEVRKFYRPNEALTGFQVTSRGQSPISESIPPHTTGRVTLRGTPASFPGAPNSALFISVLDPQGHEVATTNETARGFNEYRSILDAPAAAKVQPAETTDTLTVTAADLSLQFNKKTGLLAAASRAGKTFSFLNGPRLVAIGATPAAPARGAQRTPPTPAPESTLASLTQKADGNDLLITATFAAAAGGATGGVQADLSNVQGLKSITYRLRPNGWLTIDYAYNLTGPHEYFGVGFDYPEANVQSMRYLGNGPAPVYQNRLAGGTLDVWEKKYNNTMVGDPDDLKPGEHFDYPIFKGYYNAVRWLQLKTSEGPITALLNQDDLFVQVFAPKTPPANIIGQTGVPFPTAGISFLHAIPAIGSKFNGPKSTGPQGQPAVAKGDYTGSISLYFGEIH